MVKLTRVIEELQAKIVALEERIAELEHPTPHPPPVPENELISEELMLAIAAAVAAYLGERAHIRVVRLAPSNAWAQQGRVSIQASHRLG